MSEQERIVAAAIYYRGVTYQVPPPGRHHDVIRLMADQGIKPPEHPDQCRHQGFVTSTGRFVKRPEAFRVAGAAGQILRATAPPNLYSEDVW